MLNVVSAAVCGFLLAVAFLILLKCVVGRNERSGGSKRASLSRRRMRAVGNGNSTDGDIIDVCDVCDIGKEEAEQERHTPRLKQQQSNEPKHRLLRGVRRLPRSYALERQQQPGQQHRRTQHTETPGGWDGDVKQSSIRVHSAVRAARPFDDEDAAHPQQNATIKTEPRLFRRGRCRPLPVVDQGYTFHEGQVANAFNHESRPYRAADGSNAAAFYQFHLERPGSTTTNPTSPPNTSVRAGVVNDHHHPSAEKGSIGDASKPQGKRKNIFHHGDGDHDCKKSRSKSCVPFSRRNRHNVFQSDASSTQVDL